MSFREKSAWGMGALMLVAGLWYASIAAQIPLEAPALAQLGAVLPYVFVVVIGSIAIQVALAILAPRDAHRPADERERAAIDRAGHWSGVVLGFGVVTGAIVYLAHGQANLLFHFVIGSLIASQLAEYGLQIVLFRRGA